MTTADVAAAGPDKKRLNLAPLQKFGRSLMLPIAALPVAALMLRLGQPDLLGRDGLGWEKVAAVVGAGGGALFANLPLLFAVGVAIGVAKKADGSTALAAVVGYLVFKGVGDAVSPFILPAPKPGEDQELVNYGVLGGILCGLIAAVLWQRYYRISLPPYLAFFGGRRFVPIVTGFATLVLAVLLAPAVLLVVLTVHLALLNDAPTSAYFAQTLLVWEQGRFIRFYGLGQWLGWLWPFATLVYVLLRASRRSSAS